MKRILTVIVLLYGLMDYAVLSAQDVTARWSLPTFDLLRGGDTVRIVFVGDVMQHREQLRSAHIAGRDTVNAESYDYSSYFKYTQGRFKKAEVAVANMEFPCGAPPYRGYPAFSAPASLAAEAAKAGIDLFLCANNHICDRGAKGIAATLATYDSLGVVHTGL